MCEKQSVCVGCQRTTRFVLTRQKCANGAIYFLWVCAVCDKHNPGNDRTFFIPHEKVKSYLTPEQIEALPILLPDCVNRCACCGQRNTDVHHWAPRALFGDECEKWPKDNLCPDCHKQWHRIVTPQLVIQHG